MLAGVVLAALSLGITLNAATGVHAEQNGVVKIPAVPVPVVDVRIPLGDLEVRGETLPPLGPIGLSGNPLSIESTKIGYSSAAAYFPLPGSQLRFGLGMTLINQRTLYTMTASNWRDDQIDSSRVAGLRVAALQEFRLSRRATLELQVAASPSMHAIVDAHRLVTTPWFSTTDAARAPETASLLDVRAAVERRFGALSLVYGIRYFNYVAVFDRGKALADRNRLLLPFAGVRAAIGR